MVPFVGLQSQTSEMSRKESQSLTLSEMTMELSP